MNNNNHNYDRISLRERPAPAFVRGPLSPLPLQPPLLRGSPSLKWRNEISTYLYLRPVVESLWISCLWTTLGVCSLLLLMLNLLR